MRLLASLAARVGVVRGALPSVAKLATQTLITRRPEALYKPIKIHGVCCSAALQTDSRKQCTMVTSKDDSNPKLQSLRELLAGAEDGKGVAAFIIPTEDAHMGEYPPACDARRVFITGFTGSAGTAVVTTDAAALWTDGRYFLQAEAQLESGWALMKHGTPGCPEIEDWLVSVLPEGAAVGYDPWLHTVAGAEKLGAALAESGRRLVALPSNPVDVVWGAARTASPCAPIRPHALEWAGDSAADKLASLRGHMAKQRASALLVAALDEVAWLTNLRGGDVAHNPVFISYALVSASAATLFVDPRKVAPAAVQHLAEAGWDTAPYADVGPALATALRGASGDGTRVWIDPAKAIKNDAELVGMREAHLRDGVALVGFLAWLEREVAAGRTFTEVEIDEHLTARRAAQRGYIETSFDTIAGAGPNGAVIHYRAEKATARTVDGDTLLLLDSGGQYDCGTTDITRTMHFGTPTEHQRLCYTKVLQGHIALDRAVYPEGTPGCAIDALARAPLWSLGLNYRHGTGHGVGAALNVHEGPQSISSRLYITAGLVQGMVCSNEPGYYEDGVFGIRIENLFVVVPADTPFRYGGQTYLTADSLTVVPMQKKLMVKEKMTPEEVAWVDAYHAKVLAALSSRLEGEDLEWLKAATTPL